MEYYFEIYLIENKLQKEHWQKLYKAILLYSGRLRSFSLIFSCTDNVVRFFVVSKHDLSNLSNNIDGMILRPVSKEAIVLPHPTGKVRFLQHVTGGNILDFKEKHAVQKGLHLEYGIFRIKGLSSDKALVKNSLILKDAAGRWVEAKKSYTFFPANLLAIDFDTNTHYLKHTIPTYLNIEKSVHMLTSQEEDALLRVDTFPYLPRDYYLHLNNYEFDKHSFIIGATGSGKSKLISLYVDRLYATAQKMNYRVVIIDPHASLADDIAYLPDKKVINFNSEATELFSDAPTDISASTELTATLFKSLLGEQFNSRLERTLRFSLFVLFTAQSMSLDNLKRFLTEVELRNQLISHVSGYIPQNIIQFFGSDFNEIRTTYYADAILPIVALVDEMQLQPSLVKGGDTSLARTIQDNFLTVFSLNKISMGEKTVKTIAGLLIQQIFLLAQARTLGQRIILIIDEVSVVQNPALAAILAEARKFNLSVVLSQQYFGQIEKDIRDAIFANVYNYYVFRVSEEDARSLEGNLNIEIPAEILEREHAKGLSESDIRVKIMTELSPRECLVRLSGNGQLNPCLKARTVDAPEASQAQHDANKLASYNEAAVLPSKFVESATKESQPLTESQPDTPAPAKESVFNLSELLAQHSSSRKLVNKRKVKP